MTTSSGKSTGVLEGGRLLAVLAGLLLAMALVVVVSAGVTAEGLEMLLKATARSSALLYFAAFAAPGVAMLRRGQAAAWLGRNERPLFLSFGVSHLIHLGAILGLAGLFPEFFAARIGVGGTVAGTVVYVIIAFLCLRLIIRPSLSPSSGTIVGALQYLLWLAFASAFIVGSRKGGVYPFMAVAAIISLALRLAPNLMRGAGAAAPAKNP